MYEASDLERALRYNKPYWVYSISVEVDYSTVDYHEDDATFEIEIETGSDYDDFSYSEKCEARERYEREINKLFDEYGRKSGNNYRLVSLVYDTGND